MACRTMPPRSGDVADEDAPSVELELVGGGVEGDIVPRAQGQRAGVAGAYSRATRTQVGGGGNILAALDRTVEVQRAHHRAGVLADPQPGVADQQLPEIAAAVARRAAPDHPGLVAEQRPEQAQG